MTEREWDSFFVLEDFKFLGIPEQGGLTPYKLKQEIALYICAQANSILKQAIDGAPTLYAKKDFEEASIECSTWSPLKGGGHLIDEDGTTVEIKPDTHTAKLVAITSLCSEGAKAPEEKPLKD